MNNVTSLPRPVRYQTYSFEQICKLYLRDSPHLGFVHEDISGVIQTSHVTQEELLKDEKFKNSLWKYIRETEEWIPVFSYSCDNETPITELVDLSISENSKKYHNEDSWWATPKGHPRQENS